TSMRRWCATATSSPAASPTTCRRSCRRSSRRSRNRNRRSSGRAKTIASPRRALRGLASGTVRVEPVRVKVYGLFWQTRRRYVLQSIFGLGYGVALLIVWLAVLQGKCAELMRPDIDVSTSMKVIVAILNQLPWILLATALIKLFEMWIVLRRFT